MSIIQAVVQHTEHSAKVRSRTNGDISDFLGNFLCENTCRKIHTSFF